MNKFKSLSKNALNRLPKTPGVYAFKKGRQFLYIGKAVSLLNRVKQHKELLHLVEQLAYIKTGSETDALILENKLIKKYQPKYNTQWKDDKNYFYVGITKEPYPRVFITHQPKLKIENWKLEINYVGPFVDGKKLKQTLKDLRKVYPFRTCKALPKKPCLWYQLNQCPAPCLPAEALAKEGFFPTKHIEAYDISNIQGQEATGSMVTFINGKPDKNFYRRFKIKLAQKPNDVAMLKEVLERRLKHKEWPYPDLILIDGGKAQLNAALKIKDLRATLRGVPAWSRKIKDIKVMSLAKKNNELYMENRKEPVLLKNLPPEFSNLILRARDEAHRFARKYHHLLRVKKILNS
ncbi:MAG: hypothetical protein HYW69_02820 [Candidatus Nealsonbacteria bacterium]|nr:hypothetical protein [Candidatus Nealsonbacteria bacterium]